MGNHEKPITLKDEYDLTAHDYADTTENQVVEGGMYFMALVCVVLLAIALWSGYRIAISDSTERTGNEHVAE